MPGSRATTPRSTASALVVFAVVAIASTSWSLSSARVAASPHDDERDAIATPTFTEVAAASGLVFEHFLGSTGEFYFPEVSSAGLALLDYDNDGDLDVYFLQGDVLNPAKTIEDTVFPPRVPLPPRNRLFRNELVSSDRTGKLRFTDVTEESGTGDTGYAQGVATGDIDNDGDVDLFVTNLGADVLYVNNGDGTFTDRSAESGLADTRWTTSASFLDYDRDGLLDLFVAAYAEYSTATDKNCQGTSGRHDYCGPDAYPAVPDHLYRNLGGGKFEDVSQAVGIFREYGHGLGVGVSDFDGNGWLDIYVANDGDPNQLWMNDRGRFQNAGLLSGASVNNAGQAEAGMGVAVGDFDVDGDDDIFVTHLAGETNTLYENVGGGFFTDRTGRAGLGAPSRFATGFGTAFADFDHNGRLDLFIANGAVSIEESQGDDPYPYRQPNQLMMQSARGFVDHSVTAGAALALSEVSRGVAAGDIDNDGDIDLVVTNSSGPARLLRNDFARPSNWLVVRVIDDALGRDAYGASLRIELSDGTTLMSTIRTDTSYCSARDPRAHFGWSDQLSLRAASVSFPGRGVVSVEGLEARTFATVRVRPPDRDASTDAGESGETE